MSKLRQSQARSLDNATEFSPAETAPPVLPRLKTADESSPDAVSPARSLQKMLTESLGDDARTTDGQRWAPRSTLLLAAGVSALVWGLVAWGLASVL